MVRLIILLIVAGVCGSIGQALAGVSRGGCLVSIALGFIGALLGTWLQQQLNLPGFTIAIGGEQFPILWSIVGSALFVAVLSFISRRR